MKTLRHRRKRKGDFLSSAIFLISDISAISAAFVVAYLARFDWLQNFFQKEPPDFNRYLYVLPVVITIFIATFRQKQIYVFDTLRRRLDEIGILFVSIVIAGILLMALTFLYRDFSYSRTFFALHLILSFILICFFRHLAYWLDGVVRLATGTRVRILVMGANRSARQIIRRINKSYRNRYEVVGVLTGGKSHGEKHFEQAPIVGTLEDVFKKMPHLNADEVILTVPDFPDEKLTELFLKCENEMISFLKIPDLFGIFTSGVDIHYIDNVPLIGIKKSPLDKFTNRLLKRSFDLAASISGVILLSPVYAVIAVLVKITDGGPILYRQDRTGMDGRSFFMYKFRTMRVNAESASGPVWAVANDQRVTAFGKFLRRFNLDELPQLFNVLHGEMSIVGPRPERPHFVGKFRDQVPRYMARHKIKSGITGWAQVNGFRGNTSIAERTKYDLYYYENWSLFLDIKIILLTLFSPKGFQNAY